MNTYEEKIERLEEITEKLEMRDISLDDALKLFEEGVGLIKEIDALLHGAEGRIRKLMDDMKLHALDDKDDGEEN